MEKTITSQKIKLTISSLLANHLLEGNVYALVVIFNAVYRNKNKNNFYFIFISMPPHFLTETCLSNAHGPCVLADGEPAWSL